MSSSNPSTKPELDNGTAETREAGEESEKEPEANSREGVVDAIFDEEKSPDEKAPFTATETPLDSAVRLWRETLERGQIEPAAHHLARALSEAEREPAGDRIPGEAVLYTLGNLAPNNAGLFLSLYAACDRWNQTHVGNTDCFTGHAASRWQLLQELMQARERLSAPTFAILAQLIATDDSQLTVELVRRCEQNEGQAIMDRDRLLVYAPNVARLFGDYLIQSTPKAPERQVGRNFHWWALLLLGVLMIRVVGLDRAEGDATVDSEAPLAHAEEYRTRLEQQRQEPTSETPGGEANSALVDEAPIREPSAVIGQQRPAHAVDGDALERASSELLAPLGGKVTSEYYLIVTAREALRTGSCEEAGRALAELDTALNDASSSERAQVKTLWSLFSNKCPGRQREYAP